MLVDSSGKQPEKKQELVAYEAPVGEIVMLFLVSGGQVMGRVLARDEKYLWLTDTRQLMMIPTERGMSLNISSYTFPQAVIDQSKPMSFKLAHIAHEFQVSVELKNAWTQASSGIQVANKLPDGLKKPAGK